jgi:uncharacterized protein YegL
VQAATITFNSEITATGWSPLISMHLAFDENLLAYGTRGFSAIRHSREMMATKLKELAANGVHVPLGLVVAISDWYFGDLLMGEQDAVKKLERDVAAFTFLPCAVGEIDPTFFQSWSGKQKGIYLSDLRIAAFFRALSTSVRAASRSRPGESPELGFDKLAQ